VVRSAGTPGATEPPLATHHTHVDASSQGYSEAAPATWSPTSARHTDRYAGRLELTWTNKHLRLLAQEDGSYEWVSPSDYRIAEVRLLRDLVTVGVTHPDRVRATDNLLMRGDALNALTSLLELPEFAREYAGQVKLAYLDPPFNTQQSFLQYDDALEHSVWLTMMRDRLLQVKQLLRPDGSVWVHCNDSEQARLKVMMDEIFGTECFVTAFIWQKVDSPPSNQPAITPDHDYLLCYVKSPGAAPFRQMPDPSILAAYGSTAPDGRRYRDRLLKKNGKGSLRQDRPSMYFPIPAPDGTPVYPVHDDGREARWSVGEETVQRWLAQDQLINDEFEKKLIWKLRGAGETQGWVPYTREWAPPLPSRPWPSIWLGLKTTRQAKAHLRNLFPGVTPFETPKPEELIARVLEIGSGPRDIVLDSFLGSGTTAAVAHKMGRRWVAVEREGATFDAFARPRLTAVVNGDDPDGITEAVGWAGGGGFRILEVAPSMFAAEGGHVFLSEWATNGKLAEVTAAQLHFEYQYDPPLCGQRGRTRLAVVDGLVNPDVVRLVVDALADDEQLVLCGTAVDPAAREVLRNLRPGSSVRKIPQSILAEYRQASSSVLRRLPEAPAAAGNAPLVEATAR
jgi:adenine-specific DNA-methyltransferase